ncbi:MAG: hypothetical protein PUF51_07545 [Bifidobacteriaceae bacterium]|nr:hypothetical protein [Bifidobacteriaceae bacterium]
MSLTTHTPFRHHRDAVEDTALLARSLAMRSHLAAAIGLLLGFMGLTMAVLGQISVVTFFAILLVAAGTLCAVRSLVLDAHWRRLDMESAAPSGISLVAATTCIVAIVACIGTTAYGLLAPSFGFIHDRTWVLENGEWTRDGRVVSFTKGMSSTGSTSTSNTTSGSGTTSSSGSASDTSGASVSARPSSTPSPSLSGLMLTSLPQAVLFTGLNRTGETVQHNNALTDTDGSQALAIESATIDNRAYGYYNGEITLRNNTEGTILYADAALTALSSNGDVLKQETAHCEGPIEAGQTCEATFQIGTSSAAAIMPYTTMWFTSGDASAAREAASDDSEQHQDAAASRTAPGTVFHKASPGVPAIPL